MEFNEYKYLWPPRPKKAIPSRMLSFYEGMKWIAQYKKNGTCTVLYVTPEKKIILKTRHNDDHKAWTASPEFKKPFQELKGEGWYVLIGEVLHSKTPAIKDTIYLFDILVNNGVYLVGTTLEERLDKLNGLFPSKALAITQSHYVIAPKLWIAKTITENFGGVFNGLTAPEDEGLVLKDPKAELRLCATKDANEKWQVKCRKATKNYSF